MTQDRIELSREDCDEVACALLLTKPVITFRPSIDARTQFITSRLNREDEVRVAVKQLGDEMQAAMFKMLGVDERYVTFSFLVEI